MGTRILGIIIAILIVVGIYYGYQHYRDNKQQESGAIHWQSGEPTPEQKAAFARENSGDTPDGQSERKNETARQAAAEAAIPSQLPPQNAAQNAAQNPAGEPFPQRIAQDLHKDDGTLGSHFGSDTTSTQAGAPAYDTASPNAPNGMRYAGSGVYQWYRQGNLTWRVDTATGQSCIVYATMEEWRKQIVLSHGCGRSA